VDRPDLDLSPADAAIVAAVLAAQPRTVVVLNSPAAIVMPWAPAAGAIVHNFFPGQMMGAALADVLYGDVNPAGRLPFTVPAADGDNPLPTPEQYPGVNGTVTYSEGLFIDYRWFDANGVAPRFPFGHGLSYTTFAYTNLIIDTASAAPAVRVSCTVTNVGGRAGREVPQLYVGFPPAAAEPPWVLRGFDSTPELAPAASAPVAFELSQRDISTWDAGAHAWAPARGNFKIRVGASSRDVRLEGGFTVA
jgi:beta-glucosidase